METTTETLTVTTAGPDVSITKTEVFDVDFARWLTELKDGEITKDERTAIRRILKGRFDGNKHTATYKLGKDLKHADTGRFIAVRGDGLQGLSRDCRAALAQRYYWDVDMRNAQPTLLQQYAEKRGWVCSALRRYNENREDYITELMEVLNIERWEAKQRVTALCFGGSAVGLTQFFVSELYPELRKLTENIYKENQQKHAWVTRRPHPYGSMIAFVLQTEERKVLLAMDYAFARMGRSLDVYIHDGGLVRKKDGEQRMPEDALRRVEREVETETGYKISLAVKEMKTTFERDEDDTDLVPPTVLIDDRYAAMKFVELMGDKFVMDEEVMWVFNAETGMWGCDKATLERVVTSLNGHLVFRQMGAMGVKIYDYSGCVEKRNSLLRMLPAVAPVRDGFLRSKRQSDVNKLLFVDGIYDFETDTFTEGFDPNIVFTARMPRKFPRHQDREKMDFIRFHTFSEPFNNTGDDQTLLHELMRAATGDFTRKKLVIGLGPHDCSKGMTTTLTQTAFGSYVRSFNGNSLLHKGHANADSERDYTFVMGFVNARFAFSSEIRIPKDERHSVAVDGTLLKTLASGGDDIKARRLHENSVNVYNKAQLFIFANDMPKISPSADCVASKIVPVNWSISFVDDPVMPTEKKKDPQMSDKYKQPEYGDAFFHIIREEYAKWKASGFAEIKLPETAKLGLEDLVPAKRLGPLLLEQYELTLHPMSVVPFDDIRAYVKQEGWEGTDNKLGRELTALGLGVSRKREDGRIVLYRTGLRVKVRVTD